MVHPNRQEVPQNTDPVELELIALHELATQPVALPATLAFMGCIAFVATLEAATEEQ